MKEQHQPGKEQGPIHFYGKTNPEYEFLSNFYESPFKIGEHIYQTNQHFFQSRKFQGTPQQIEVINAKNPRISKALGRKYKMNRPQQWPQIKEKVMIMGLRGKFDQNKDIRKKLLDTGNRELHEHTSRDKYWGDGGAKKTGKSRLGVLIMQVREQFKKEQK